MDSKPLQLNHAERASLLALSRETLRHSFGGNRAQALHQWLRKEHLTDSVMELHPCFVTLTKKNGLLRGCIGALTAHNPLYKNVHEFTGRAAFEDPRFHRVSEMEASDLVIHISVLGPLQPLADIENLELGKQGLYISHGEMHGVLLANVATQYGWTAEQFLEQTCRKAGLPPENVSSYDIKCFTQISFQEG